MIEQTISAKLIAWLSTLVPAIVGAAISLKLASEKSTFIDRLISFIFGVALAHYVGGTVVGHFNIDPNTMLDDSIILASGIFGMATVSELNRQLPEVIKSAGDRIKGWINK